MMVSLFFNACMAIPVIWSQPPGPIPTTYILFKMYLPVPERQRRSHAVTPCFLFYQSALLRAQDRTSLTDISYTCEFFYKF